VDEILLLVDDGAFDVVRGLVEEVLTDEVLGAAEL
jgi:hypothetical protein